MGRRLAAIMAADMVGYSRLTRADEEGTLTALKTLRADLCSTTITVSGRIASSDLLPNVKLLPHLICSRLILFSGALADGSRIA